MTRHSTDSFAIEDPVVAAALRFIREQAVFGCSVREVVRHVGISAVCWNGDSASI